MNHQEHRDGVRFTPAMYLDHYAKERGLRREELNVGPLVVGTWFPRVTEKLAEGAGATRNEKWPFGRGNAVYTGEATGRKVSFVTFPVGAPGTVLVMEELIAGGARCFVGLGMAGSLQPAAPIGSYLLPGECVREEGTSGHYLPPGEVVGPDPALQASLGRLLAAAGKEGRPGPHWTTDAPYREFVWKIEKYRAAGVLGVDMETSATYALGRFYGLPVANLLVVSDEVWREWRPAFETEELRKAMREAVAAVLAGLPTLAGLPSVAGPPACR